MLLLVELTGSLGCMLRFQFSSNVVSKLRYIFSYRVKRAITITRWRGNGYSILKQLLFNWCITEVVLSHHAPGWKLNIENCLTTPLQSQDMDLPDPAHEADNLASIMLGIDWIDIKFQVFCITFLAELKAFGAVLIHRNPISLLSGTLPEREATKKESCPCS